MAQKLTRTASSLQVQRCSGRSLHWQFANLVVANLKVVRTHGPAFRHLNTTITIDRLSCLRHHLFLADHRDLLTTLDDDNVLR